MVNDDSILGAAVKDIKQLRADLNEVLDALEDVSPYVFAFQHQKRASAKIQHAAAVLAKYRPSVEKCEDL